MSAEFIKSPHQGQVWGGGDERRTFCFFQYMHFENKVRNTVTVPYSENVDTSGSTMPACAAYNYLTNDC